ncbi:tyrosine-type recombinase/integrase [Rhizobium laguerreae]|uniref:tyrosine-type recombinase/integrase n=1 Tax=Rhizobium laguerreae TaxID=1076926 RepID=UPI001C91D5CF|nr:hypothetical protein [Rhizobium laguerreae]MBY3363793.1 hypothetical protein [Rhizobium laguerreae]
MIEHVSEEPIQRDRKNNEVPLADVLSHFIDVKLTTEPGDGKKAYSRPDEVLKYVTDLVDWWGDKTVTDVNRVTCQKYWKACTTLNAARNRLEYLRRALTLALEDSIIAAMPKVFLPEKAKPRSDFLERKDIARMLWACLTLGIYTHNADKSKDTGLAGTQVRTLYRPRRHLMPYIIMAMYTGTRSNRMFTASFIRQKGRPWIDLEEGVFHRSAPDEDVPKNKQAPTIRIPLRLLRHMRRWYRLGRRYPIEYNGKPITRSKALGKLMKECVPDKNVVPHSFRHTAATWLMKRSELPIHDISGFLGMSMEMLDKVYGHHRTSHQTGIDDAITAGGIGKIKKRDDGGEEFSYDGKAPGDTGRNKPDQPKPSRIKLSVNSQKTRKAA